MAWAMCPLVLKLKSNHYAPPGLTHKCVTWLCGISQYTRPGTRAKTQPCAPILNVHTACVTGVSVGRVRHMARPHWRVSPVLRKIF
ncbi:hypothetical protein F383_15161 [Gossypium arboreum]|uniref:Uncharacterized protein n=1 Tax=Gossypium arboreum TaxID=29729 RepID=A0A0B0PWG0_GOSAR|nr:hypothetical protein F383_15161 [Gossypium arboreum]